MLVLGDGMHYTGSFYYSVLLWAAILYGAGVVFKFGSVFLYTALMPWFSEEKPKPKAAKKIPMPPAKWVLWTGLGIYLLLSGLTAIPPQVALATHAELLRLPDIASQAGLGRELSHAWVSAWSLHPITYNIVVFMFQAVLGVFLLTEHDTLLGRITLVFCVAWGLFVAVFPQGLGLLFSGRDSLIAGAPGSGFVTAFLAWLLLMPSHQWRTGRIQHTASRIGVVLLGLGTLWQLTFFSPHRLYRQYPRQPALVQPHFLWFTVTSLRSVSLQDAIWLNILWVLVFLAAAWAMWQNRHTILVWIASILWLLVWWIGQDFGLTAQFGLALNTAPLWTIWLWSLHAAPDHQKVYPARR